jgi:uncharacterized protein YqgV (UPF0045/DUF77 family)
MQISVEISHYAFDQDFVSRVQAFIDELNSFEGIQVVVNAMSTQVFGEFDMVMPAVQSAVRKHFRTFEHGVFVMKILNGDARFYLQ